MLQIVDNKIYFGLRGSYNITLEKTIKYLMNTGSESEPCLKVNDNKLHLSLLFFADLSIRNTQKLKGMEI